MQLVQLVFMGVGFLVGVGLILLSAWFFLKNLGSTASGTLEVMGVKLTGKGAPALFGVGGIAIVVLCLSLVMMQKSLITTQDRLQEETTTAQRCDDNLKKSDIDLSEKTRKLDTRTLELEASNSTLRLQKDLIDQMKPHLNRNELQALRSSNHGFTPLLGD